MKLRLQEDAVTVRLTRDEIHILAEAGRVEAATPVGGGAAIRYAVEAAGDKLGLAWADGVLTVRMPEADARRWATSGQIGFQRELEAVTLRVEWDFKSEQSPEQRARRQAAMEQEAQERFDREVEREERDEPSD